MKINNGEQRCLIIPGIIMGNCGVQGETVSFRPNQRGEKPEGQHMGLLGAQAVRLQLRASPDNDGLILATFEVVV